MRSSERKERKERKESKQEQERKQIACKDESRKKPLKRDQSRKSCCLILVSALPVVQCRAVQMQKSLAHSCVCVCEQALTWALVCILVPRRRLASSSFACVRTEEQGTV